MLYRIVAVPLLALSVVAATGPKKAAPVAIDCMEADFVAPRATIELQRSYLSPDGYFIGVFELVNYEFKPGLTIHLSRWPGQAYFESLSTVVEFMDLNGTWVELMAGRILQDPADLKTIRLGEGLVFHLRLFTQDLLKHGGSDFRIKIHPESVRKCEVSFPFHVLPAPQLPVALESMPHPQVLRPRPTRVEYMPHK